MTSELGNKKPKLAEAESAPKLPPCSRHDANVIVCENEARMHAVLSVARAFNEPYVPFKILFVEGMMRCITLMGIWMGSTEPAPSKFR